LDEINAGMKKCNFCDESISADARRCPYCGSLLEIKINKFEFLADTNTQKPVSTIVNDSTSFVQSCAIYSADTRKDVRQPSMGAVLDGNNKKGLGNYMKVFLTVICTVVPGIGQLAGIIIAIIFMNTEDDTDRRSFGLALLIASLIFFVISCLACFMIILASSMSQVSF